MTVSVPVYQTVFETVFETVRVPVTTHATATSVTTMRFYVTIIQSVTEWSTVISVTTAMGMLGAMPSMIFGAYSDLALILGGVLGGVAVALAPSRHVMTKENGKSQDMGKVDAFTMKDTNLSDYIGEEADYPDKTPHEPDIVAEQYRAKIPIIAYFTSDSSYIWSDINWDRLTEAEKGTFAALGYDQDSWDRRFDHSERARKTKKDDDGD